MRPSTIPGLILGVALIGSPLGCRDSTPAAPQPALDIRDPSDGAGGAEGDSTSTPPASQPAEPTPAPPDTAPSSAPPPLPASFTLRGVVLGAVSTSDTTRAERLPGVVATLYRIKDADGTPVQPELLAGSAVTDAGGEFVFRDLAPGHYRLDLKAAAGTPYADASRTIAPPWSSEIAVHVVLLRKR
jgi:hypothetical protein